jgi:hypothetical protein
LTNTSNSTTDSIQACGPDIAARKLTMCSLNSACDTTCL